MCFFTLRVVVTNSLPVSMPMPLFRHLTSHVAATLALVAAVSAAPFAASAQSAFGAPIVNYHAPTNKTVVNRQVVPKLPIVADTERDLVALTSANATGAQVVTLPYGEHKTYQIPLRQGMITTFALPSDEPIQFFGVNDPGAVEVNVNPATNTAMLKLNATVALAGSILTAKHKYYFAIIPAGRNEAWYQGVSWSFGNDTFGSGNFGGGNFTASGMPSIGQPAASPLAPVAAPASDNQLGDIYTGTPNFNYNVRGDAPFKPVAIWDNGRFTWIQFAKRVQELPALFIDGPNGLEIVNYTVHADGTQLLVNRLMPQFVLKLGKVGVVVKAGSNE